MQTLDVLQLSPGGQGFQCLTGFGYLEVPRPWRASMQELPSNKSHRTSVQKSTVNVQPKRKFTYHHHHHHGSPETPGVPQHTVSRKSGNVAVRKRSKLTTVLVSARCSAGSDEASRASGEQNVNGLVRVLMGYISCLHVCVYRIGN